MGHHASTYGIRRGSELHAVLRLLDACELSCSDSLSAAGDTARYTPRRWHLEVLSPLHEMGLLHWDRRSNTWGTTDDGSSVSRKLGPLGEEKPATAPGSRPSPAATPLQHCGPRRYAATNTGRPPVPRPGSEDAARLPSRMGDRLHWPDGRITDALARAAA